MSEAAERPTLDRLLEPALLSAAQVCALPHWLDDQLAEHLLELTGHNGTSKALVARVKSLPLAQPFERTAWRIDEEARIALVDGLRKTDFFAPVSHYLAKRFGSERDGLDDPASRHARVSQWRSAYHFADVDPDEAAGRLTDLVTQSAKRGRIGDVESAIELFEQHHALAPYVVELAYARGRRAYAQHDDEEARAHFKIVWEAGRPNLETGISGNLIAVVNIKTRTNEADTEPILRRALEIVREIDDELGEAHILSTLVNYLLARKNASSKNLEELEGYAQRAVDIGISHSDGTLASSYSTLGQVQVTRGTSHFGDARQSFERAVKLAEEAGNHENLKVALLSWSWLARSQKNFPEACELVDRVLLLDIEDLPTSALNVRLTAKRLAKFLRQARPLPGWEVLNRSNGLLAYARAGRLVVVRYPANTDPDTDPSIDIPAELRGAWVGRANGIVVDLGEQASVRHMLGRWAGAVFDRPSASATDATQIDPHPLY